MRRWMMAAGLVAGLLALYNSDTLLLALPESLSQHFERKLAGRLRRAGVLAVWTFDGLGVREAVDGARAENFGTLLTAGRHGRARNFIGEENAYIATNTRWAELGTQYTISTWVKVEASEGDQSIVFDGGEPGSGIMLSGGEMVFAVPDAERRTASYPFAKYGEFVNVVGVADLEAGTAALYENGVLRDTAAIRGVRHGEGDISFGKYGVYKIYHPLNGAMDETIIWRRALSPDEVREVARDADWFERTTRRVALGYVVGLRLTGALSTVVSGAGKVFDLFNPLYHESRIYRSDLPTLKLRLSRNDLRYLERFRRGVIERGYVTRDRITRRRVRLAVQGEMRDVELSPYGGDPRLWVHPKMSFTLEGDAVEAILGARRILLVPPEANGLLRPLFHQRLAGKYGMAHGGAGLAAVWINGMFRGLYAFEEHLVDGYPGSSGETESLEMLGRLPVPGAALIAEYDALRREVEPLLVRDKRITWSSREIRYRVRRDRDALMQVAEAMKGRTERDEVERVKEYLNERHLLDGNPSASYIIDDLNPDAVAFPAVRVTWSSSRPDVIAADGTVTRPRPGAATRVQLVAAISRGEAIAHKTLDFVVMPEIVKLPALRLVVPGEVSNLHRTPCLVELIEEGGRKRTGWLRGALKFRGNTTLRYPKKSYSLRMEAPHGFFDFSSSKIIHLISAYADESLMKNKLAYDIFRSFGRQDSPRYSPRVRLVEAFINDEYHGIYQMSERVDRHLLGFERSEKDSRRRSVIYKAQHSDARFWKFVRHAYVQVEPNPRDGEYWKPLEELTGLIGSSDVDRFRSGIEHDLDVSTYIDFHILVNVLGNKEGIRFNLFLGRGDGDESRFVLVPWDYDKSLYGEHGEWLTNSLFRRLGRDLPGFAARFAARWWELREGELSEERVEQLIEEVEGQLRESVEREYERWPRGSGDHGRAVREIRDWLRKRLRFLDTTIGRP